MVEEVFQAVFYVAKIVRIGILIGVLETIKRGIEKTIKPSSELKRKTRLQCV